MTDSSKHALLVKNSQERVLCCVYYF